MVDLPNVDPLPSVPPMSSDRPERADLEAVLEGLEPGWYTARSLLPRYNVWADRNGRRSITAKTLGESLQRALDLERRRAHGNVTAFRVGGTD